MTVRVLIVDDEVTDPVRHWLEDAEDDLVVVGDAPGPAQAVFPVC